MPGTPYRLMGSLLAVPINFDSPSPPEQQLSVPQVNEENILFVTSYLSPYHVNFNDHTSRLGGGSFGVVCSGVDKRTEKLIACKEVRKVFGDLRTAVKIYREVSFMNSFQHENVIGLLGIEPFTIPAKKLQRLYVYMDHMPQNLSAYVERNEKMEIEHIQLIVYQILRAVKYIHSGNIMHRDIKPDNILINDERLVKLCDFGLARSWTPRETEDLSLCVVTERYKAPELLMCNKRYTTSIDIWSVGVTVGEIFKRERMFVFGGMSLLREIVNLVGKPTEEEIAVAPSYIRRQMRDMDDEYLPTSLLLMSMSRLVTNEAAHFISLLLTFNHKERINVNGALAHPFVKRGRELFHTTLCSCCANGGGVRQSAADLEPNHPNPFPANWERELAHYDMPTLQQKVSLVKPVVPLSFAETQTLYR